MKFGFALLAGLLVAEGATTNININAQGCQIQRVDKKDVFGCPCTGGSGDYDWHFSDLPDGWNYENNRIFAPEGKFAERKIYGARVQVFDRKTQDSIKKSLFFSFENGRVRQVADHDFNFDVNLLLPGKSIITSETQRVQRIFNGVDGIGGGSGLPRLIPYFTGNGFYKGDNTNPFISKLPIDSDIDKIIEGGNSNDLRVFFVNAARSKAPCKDIDRFLNQTLLKIRIKIGRAKDDVDGAKQLIATLQNQIKNLQEQLKIAQTQDANTAALNAQLAQLKLDRTKAQEDKTNYQSTLDQAIKQANQLQTKLSNIIHENRKLKVKDQQRKQEIAFIDNQIAQLQNKINELNAKKNDINKNAQADKNTLDQSNKKVAELNEQIKAAKTTINETRLKIKDIFALIEANLVKIADTERQLRIGNYKQRSEFIKKQTNQVQKRLDDAKTRLQKIQPYYDDLTKSYDDYIKVEHSNYNTCYKTLFNDNEVEFKEDNDGNVQFSGQYYFDKYLEKIFGAEFKTSVNLKQQRGGIQYFTNQLNRQIRLKRSNIFSENWIAANGNARVNDYGQSVGQIFIQNDFDCNQLSKPIAYKGRILSISRNIASILNDKNQKCQVYLGGCTRIEALNKALPQVGDQIYWKGIPRQGKINEYNAQHVLCR